MEAARDRRRLLSDLAWLACAWAFTAALVAISRAPAAEAHHRVKETSDVYVLPPPQQVVAMSLGHRAAAADYLWAGVLVEQGLHTQEKRRFGNLPYLIDTINELDPTFRDPYLLIGALTTFQTTGVPEEDVRRARTILERGVRNLPNDAEILVEAGSFIGLLAPSSHPPYLSDPAEKAQWKLDGAAILGRAAELGGDSKYLGWHALGGASLLRKGGKRREAVQFLQNALAGTDDDELRARINTMLDNMAAAEGELQQSELRKADVAFRKRQNRFYEIWGKAYPLVSKTAARVMGPPFDAAYCAGGKHRDDERCALDWAGWAARVEAAQSGN